MANRTNQTTAKKLELSPELIALRNSAIKLRMERDFDRLVAFHNANRKEEAKPKE